MTQRNQYHKDQVFINDYDRRFSVSIKFKVDRVRFQKGDFAILSVHVLENDKHILFPQNQLSIKGTFPHPKRGDIYWAKGLIQHSEDYGYTLNAKNSGSIIYPKERGAIIKYIQSNIKGLGKVRASKIVDAFGPNTLSMLAKDPERLLHIEGLGVNQAIVKSVRDHLSHSQVVDAILAHLAGLNIQVDIKSVFQLFERYGINTLDLLKSNPYLLADISPLYWSVCDRMYVKQLQSSLVESTGRPYLWKKEVSFPPRIRTALKYYLKWVLEDTGSLAVPINQIMTDFKEGVVLEDRGSFKDQPALKGNFLSEAETQKYIQQLIQEGDVVKVQAADGSPYLYLRENYQSEQRLIKNVQKFIKTSRPVVTKKEVDQYIHEFEVASGFKLAERQRLAVDLLVNHRISILTGGPGTGKTQTLKVIRDFIWHLKETGRIEDASMTFLAPTGKAAKRMSEVLQLPTSTIHRKLKLRGFGQDEHPVTIEEKYIIVDEFSMVDVHLASQLFHNISPDSHILLVGDEDQLPSVGPGLVLRDLMASGKVPTVRLNEVFRQSEGSELITNSRKMRDGIGYHSQQVGTLIFNQQTEEPLADTYFIEGASVASIQSKIIRLIHRLQTTYNYPLESIMVLTAQNTGPLGTRELNRMIQLQFNESEPSYLRASDNTLFKEGDPVMQQINDYEWGVFNGEVGVVEEIDDTGVTVLFDDEREVIYTGAMLGHIELAYVITIHKSQGSQSPVVIQLVDRSHIHMLNRSLVYTGYTRTEEVNIMIGQYETLNKALDNTDNLKRVSLISERI